MPQPTQRYQLKVTVDSPERLRFVPYGIELDFGRLLKDNGDDGHFDRFSVLVRKVNPQTGALDDVHFNLSDDFLVSGKGKVNWLIEDTAERDYIISYDTRERGPWPPPDYIGLVGNGDCLRFNDGKLHPLHVGMAANAVAVDWDGDGRTDIISTQIYSHTLGAPWFCIRLFLNEGTNDTPVHGEGIPLRFRDAEGFHVIESGYCLELCDWNDDGRMDLITFPYWGAELRFYR
ncbi:MAG: VCBS repeat-containing protein, partial [Armatimonadota bacterium]